MDAYLRDGYRPLEAHENIRLHQEQWNSFVALLDQFLSPRWEQGIGEGDYYLDLDPVNDRFVCVEVSSEAMLSQDLVEIVHSAVVSFPEAYCVDICDSWGYMKTANGDFYPHFNIFVEKERILIYSESDLALRRIGLSVEA